ncbi:unnamed protein product [Heligmosomoides polygyrus]|uniref:Amiloride-sensitive sodium channel n=1 Tax=Heligmosomoides polygyrus TaxID=6339 RepID=A0A183GWT2_HELPZ|nr:unnamed protein product [Heligmosomoides polygyrus]
MVQHSSPMLQKVLKRLDAPYGSCSDTFRPDPYIYEEHYSPEGCHRNCFQLKVLQQCGCGDPRFPLPNGDERPFCSAKSVADRKELLHYPSRDLLNYGGAFSIQDSAYRI